MASACHIPGPDALAMRKEMLIVIAIKKIFERIHIHINVQEIFYLPFGLLLLIPRGVIAVIMNEFIKKTVRQLAVAAPV
jgi:hypothetical protein